MKQIQFLFPLMLLVFSLIGCDDRSDNTITPTPTSPEPVVTYDLGEYLIPSTSQVNIYSSKTSEKSGVQIYRETNTSGYQEKYEINGSVVTMTENSDTTNISHLKESYTLNENNITLLNHETNTSLTLERNTTLKNVFLSENTTEVLDGMSGESNYTCRIQSYSPEKTIDDLDSYPDVLEEVCSKVFAGSGTFGGQKTTVKSTEVTTTFYAKSVGEILSIQESCTQNTVGTVQGEESCTKKEVTLLSKVVL